MSSINQTFKIGGELDVNRIGFGAMRLTGQPGNFGPYRDWQGGIKMLRRAIDLGVNFFDSAHSYGPEWADKILGEALPADQQVVIATKGGITKLSPDKMRVSGSPERLTTEIELALKNLKRDTIDLFQLHRLDPDTPIEVSVEALAHAKERGLIKHIGLSNITREQLDRALQIAEIATVQNRYNQAETEQDDLVDYTRKKGIAFIPYGPLGAHPLRQGAKLPPKASIAWLLQRSPNIIVIPGTTSIDHLVENMDAWSLIEHVK